jgi:ComF family protein
VGLQPSGLLQRLLTAVFPPRCIGCGLRGVDLCDECRAGVPWLQAAVCPYCARPSRLARICAACDREGPELNGVRAACQFEGVARAAIHDLKYRRIRSRAGVLADLLMEALARRPLAFDVLVPVPLAPGRLRHRGFNQSELVAQMIGRTLGVELVSKALERTRETSPQVGRTAQDRSANILDAFACRLPEAVHDRRVAIVDDVMTTGATLAACAEPLRAAGAARVYGLVVAREV